MLENLRLLLRLFSAPAAAMSDILDRASLLFSLTAVFCVSLLLRTRFDIGFFTPLLLLAAAYAPGVLILSVLLARIAGGVGEVFRRDYAPLLTCIGMAWSAAFLPLAVAARLYPVPGFLVYAAAAASLYFLILMFFAVRTVFGAENGAAAGVVGLSWLPLLGVFYLWGPVRYLLGWVASPFVLILLYFYLRNEAAGLGAGLRTRQNFRRMLDAAAINPHDGEAQYQLGLIYQQRRQYTEAIRRFQAAVAIDPSQTDAHFQLGCIARRQDRLKDALAEFQIVLDQDEKHHQSEVLRELGALYNSARQYEDARQELERYIERRPYDPEGLCYYGRSLEGLGKVPEARDMYARAIEAARMAPPYLRRSAAKWSRLAQKEIRNLSVAG